MLAILIGYLCFIVGLAVLLLPLMVTELSRQRDGFWGAAVLLMGLVFVTSYDLLEGPPSLALFIGSGLIGRLGYEVAQSRWQQLSQEEKVRLQSIERWSTSFQQLNASFARLGLILNVFLKFFQIRKAKSIPTKKWVRKETSMTQVLEQGSEKAIADLIQDDKDV